MFKLHQKDEHLYAELRMDQFDHPYLAPISLGPGGRLGGYTLNFDEQWVICSSGLATRCSVVRRNIRYQAKNDLAGRPGSRDHLHRFDLAGHADPEHQRQP